MAPFLILLVSLVFFISCAVGDVKDEFENPPDASTKPKSAGKNPIYNVGDEVDFSWNTNADKVDVFIQQGSDGGSLSALDTSKQASIQKYLYGGNN
jgi:hypothetical protein